MTNFSYDFPYPSQRSPVMARNVVATSQPLAAQAGIQMLLKGGNAVDAALAAAIALTVVEPTGNGLGSDAFAIVWDGARLHGLNASGRSPASWTPERFAAVKQMPARGWESVTVPGAVSAWVELSEKFGRLPFETLFEPGLDYARNGFHVSPAIAGLWNMRSESVWDQPGFRECFMPDGRAPRAGELFINRPIGESLETIARSRGEAFYRGALADAIVRCAEQHGAGLNLADLDAHKLDWCGTVSTRFRDVAVHEIPPNGQGIAALMALGMLEHTQIDAFHPDSPESLHLQIEAMKLAFADVERYIGDPAVMEMSVEALLSPDYLRRRARLIDLSYAGTPGAGAPRDGGTVYLTTADASGMMVSFIQSNYNGFGSGVVVPGTGISLQNRGSGFTLEAGHPNRVGPSKRPFHTIIPGFLMRDGEPLMSFGVMGGPMQAQGHVQMVLRTQAWNQNPQTACDAPRWRVTEGRAVAVESAMDDAAIQALEERGHIITREEPDVAFGFGGAQLIHRIAGGYVAGSDHRKDGVAIGF
ncbi:gamma-glutamyltransferase family protein [Aurantimonas sp. C2-6-R+9]|uniref:gamma-glutamyltransferase family protein n=1 Tax=unclassified Aurantimonas TaxID=2638230 RepID=UPI002E179426|nr:MULTISPECIES: gamma-glutamyltransferase family protein [unclassified Aurantimonas]MEC5293132.1 gamma-glutamyltransferase family protein [Aurantimonas sp. C2-3-R2]MEC5383216.1 gamma-glutamyltransferase family protein [Aurantimonas sp. C2-6-R+9]MEC5414200.1 gamma-glutamyltransferase family protein [Aurantimonas sp. C2-4-R8]